MGDVELYQRKGAIHLRSEGGHPLSEAPKGAIHFPEERKGPLTFQGPSTFQGLVAFDLENWVRRSRIFCRGTSLGEGGGQMLGSGAALVA
jgi:hypothetical protein